MKKINGERLLYIGILVITIILAYTFVLAL